MEKCHHPDGSREFVRIIARNGANQVFERCKECDANVRGPGVWVPHDQLACPVDQLPVSSDRRPRTDQPELF